MMKKRKTLLIAVVAFAVVAGLLWWQTGRERPAAATQAEPAEVKLSNPDSATMTIADLLELAREAREHAIVNLDDYTARFVKRERSAEGVLSPETAMEMKVQTRHRGGKEGAPMRVYLRFVKPENLVGREVLWAEDLTEDKLVVREAGLLSLMPPVTLDPEGMIAMRDQRYPISEIGLTKLIEKLIERGEAEQDRPGVAVKRTEDHLFDGVSTWLIQLNRKAPTGDENDFSLAEIIFDPARQLIVRYRSFGWPSQPGEAPPLLESYTYHDLRTNVGLTDKDFSASNPEYNF